MHRSNRIEIFKDNEWQEIFLAEETQIKYNKLINRIAKPSTREISHTNTFSILPVYDNIKTLGLNTFNKRDLARALNAKYPAKYYVENQLIQEGFIVINNSNSGIIKLNFIDDSLDITDKWSNTKFDEMLRSDSPNMPADYQAAIDEMRTYKMEFGANPTYLSEVGTRGYELSLFPNNLNSIGDKFQLDENEQRQDNAFNPFQSRPIFCSKVVFDLAAEFFGYTPIYDPSVSQSALERTFIVSNGLNSNPQSEGSFASYGIVNTTPDSKLFSTLNGDGSFRVRSALEAPATRSLRPANIPGWNHPNASYENSYLNTNCVFVPTINNNSGTVIYTIKFVGSIMPEPIIDAYQFYVVWENATVGQPVIFDQIQPQRDEEASDGEKEIQISKSSMLFPPAGAGNLIGVFASAMFVNSSPDAVQLQTVQIQESSLPLSETFFDKYGQFLAEQIDLTFAAPKKSIKNLISGLMEKDGILLSISEKRKEIMYFTYSRYNVQKELGNFHDWSEYFLEYSRVSYNTDYGNEYGRFNEIGLKNPYSGNTFTIDISSNDDPVKNKENATNFNSKFKDIENVVIVPNSINPYLEYTNKGLGLVERSGTVGGLLRSRATGVSATAINDIPALKNVDHTELPEGILDWYTLVGNAVKVEARFLFPVHVMKNIDITIPVYIEKLGGYYIIEEIVEYKNDYTPTIVDLIKLIDRAEYSNDFNNDFNI